MKIHRQRGGHGSGMQRNKRWMEPTDCAPLLPRVEPAFAGPDNEPSWVDVVLLWPAGTGHEQSLASGKCTIQVSGLP
ncbi:MAG: hypothetical protein L6414_23730 [Hydrogenophaga sp.]|nr:hypothetical protein [Hydrogenophaga sp.]